MATRLFSSLDRKIAPYAPGVPLPVLVQFVRDAAIEACDTTLAWRVEQDPVTLAAGAYLYTYSPPNDAEVSAVIHSALDGITIPFVSQDLLHAYFPAWPQTDTEDQSVPQVLSQFGNDQFAVAPVPDGAYEVKMFLAVKPTLDADGMEEAVFDELEQAILHGALARLFELPERSWTDVKEAAKHRAMATYRMSQYRVKTNLTNGRSSLSVRMVPFE